MESDTSDATTSSGKKWNMKLTSWNVNGVRAWVKVDLRCILSAVTSYDMHDVILG